MLILTLMPIIIHLPNIFSGFSSEINFHPFIDWQLQRGDSLTESLLNISLFIPFGFLIRKNTKLTPLQTILIGFLFSICIEILQPLLTETFAKLQNTSAYDAQTGPARRNDSLTIANHLAMLDNNNYKEIYEIITNSIINTYGRKEL